MKNELSGLEKYMVLRFHPRSIFIDLAGMPWAVYFLWRHQWAVALAVGLACAGLRVAAVDFSRVEEYAGTWMGKMAFLHLQPVNMAVQFAGIVLGIWAIWVHAPAAILASASLLFLGHLAGWEEFLEARSTQTETPMAA